MRQAETRPKDLGTKNLVQVNVIDAERGRKKLKLWKHETNKTYISYADHNVIYIYSAPLQTNAVARVGLAQEPDKEFRWWLSFSYGAFQLKMSNGRKRIKMSLTMRLIAVGIGPT